MKAFSLLLAGVSLVSIQPASAFTDMHCKDEIGQLFNALGIPGLNEPISAGNGHYTFGYQHSGTDKQIAAYKAAMAEAKSPKGVIEEKLDEPLGVGTKITSDVIRRTADVTIDKDGVTIKVRGLVKKELPYRLVKNPDKSERSAKFVQLVEVPYREIRLDRSSATHRCTLDHMQVYNGAKEKFKLTGKTCDSIYQVSRLGRDQETDKRMVKAAIDGIKGDNPKYEIGDSYKIATANCRDGGVLSGMLKSVPSEKGKFCPGCGQGKKAQ